MNGALVGDGNSQDSPGPREARDTSPPTSIPPGLVVAAGWAWRVLLVVGAFVALGTGLSRLYLVTLPVFFAILLSALLHPLVALLRRWHFSRILSTLGALVIAFVVLGGVGWFVVSQAAANSQDLLTEVQGLLDKAQSYAEKLPFANAAQLESLRNSAIGIVERNSASLAKDVLAAGTVAAKSITGLIVTLFVTFFFLDEGDRIYSWIVRLAPGDAQPSLLGAGYRAWNAVSGWTLGTALIAAFHGIVIGTILAILGVPLAVPLAVLVFLGSFIPVVGVLVFGGLSVVITLITQGWVFALIVLAVLVGTGQVEAHVLQPFVVGRAVKLHPVAIALTLTAGAVIGGIVGAIVAIPIVAAVHAAVKYLTGVEDLDGVVRRGARDRMTPAVPPQYAPLPLYAARRDPPATATAPEAPGSGPAVGADAPEVAVDVPDVELS